MLSFRVIISKKDPIFGKELEIEVIDFPQEEFGEEDQEPRVQTSACGGRGYTLNLQPLSSMALEALLALEPSLLSLFEDLIFQAASAGAMSQMSLRQLKKMGLYRAENDEESAQEATAPS